MRRFEIMTMKDKRMVTREWAKRYQESSKTDRGRILDEFTALTGYNRSYASFVLRHCGKKARMKVRDEDVVFVLGERAKKKLKVKYSVLLYG